MSIRHEARGGLAEQMLTRKQAADWAANVGRDMWLGGVQECLRLAREHLRGSDGGEINGWEDLERAVERL